MTALALQFYLFGLPFAAIDQPLVFAFYARKNTLLPNLVQFVAVAIYLVVALALMRPLGFIGLVTANSAMLTGHALIMLALTRARLGGLGGQGVLALTIKVLVASSAMCVVVFFIAQSFDSILLQVFIAIFAGGAVYIALLRVLRVREVMRVWEMVLARVGGHTTQPMGNK
jgi:putative peptidoglycan lipid II flippase